MRMTTYPDTEPNEFSPAQLERRRMAKEAFDGLTDEASKKAFSESIMQAKGGEHSSGRYMAWSHCHACMRGNTRFYIYCFEEYEEILQLMTDHEWTCRFCGNSDLKLSYGYSNGERKDDDGKKIVPPRFLHVLNTALAAAKGAQHVEAET